MGDRRLRAHLMPVVHRKNGELVEVPMTYRFDTVEEVSVYGAQGVLQCLRKASWLSRKLRDAFHSTDQGTGHLHARWYQQGRVFSPAGLAVAAQRPGKARDALLLRVIGSPDPYGKQIDGMGAATSSTSKTVVLSRSTRPDHDVDYLFGQVSIDQALVDWSGNCGNLSADGFLSAAALGQRQVQMSYLAQSKCRIRVRVLALAHTFPRPRGDRHADAAGVVLPDLLLERQGRR